MDKPDETSMQGTDEANPIDYHDAVHAYFILRVTDMSKALEFFKDVFGFTEVFRLPDWAELSLPSNYARLGLSLAEEGTERQGSGQLMLCVNDLNATRDYLISKGVETKDVEIGYVGGIEVGRSKYGYDFFVMLDPFGNEIMFAGNAR
jgi:catechol 2,3-dioxygenase-like lactoylglutathione lyase family enzyme